MIYILFGTGLLRTNILNISLNIALIDDTQTGRIIANSKKPSNTIRRRAMYLLIPS